MCWYAASPAAGEVKKRGNAEDHAADQRHNQEDQPPGRTETQPMNQPSKEQHQEKRLGHEHQSDRIEKRVMQRGYINQREVEKHAVRTINPKMARASTAFFWARLNGFIFLSGCAHNTRNAELRGERGGA
jgi:metal-dependent hydrolase (beta-lactamase superfamily II)